MPARDGAAEPGSTRAGHGGNLVVAGDLRGVEPGTLTGFGQRLLHRLRIDVRGLGQQTLRLVQCAPPAGPA